MVKNDHPRYPHGAAGAPIRGIRVPVRRTGFFNLPALGRCQPLYIPLRVKQRPVFLLNSRQSRFTEIPTLRRDKAFPEVTPLICRVP